MRLYLFFILLLSVNVFATDKSCEIEGAVRCPCPASTNVTCAGVTGYINGNEKVKAATLNVTTTDGKTKQIELTEAQLSKYSAGVMYGIDGSADLKKVLGLNSNDRINVSKFSVDSTVSLYEDTDAKKPIGRTGNGNKFSANYSVEKYKGCQPTSDYSVYAINKEAAKKCGCTGKIPVVCSIDMNCDPSADSPLGANGTAACAQVNGKCPSFKDCYDDPNVDGEFNDQGLYEKSTSTNSISR